MRSLETQLMSFCSLSLYPSLKLYILFFRYEILTWGEPYPVEIQPQQERQCSRGVKSSGFEVRQFWAQILVLLLITYMT